MLPDYEIVAHVQGIFEQCKKKRVKVVVDLSDDMLPREESWIDFLRGNGLSVEMESYNDLFCTEGIFSRNRYIHLVAQARLTAIMNYMEQHNMGNEIKKLETIMGDSTCERVSIGGCQIIVVREEVYGLLSYKLVARKPEETNFAFHIVEHCNLNCQMCNKFSPIADEGVIDSQRVIQDVERLAKITNRKARTIVISGGEPLLHPELESIIKGMHKSFPDVRIQLQTNGLLLAKKEDTFFEMCKKNNTFLWITKYPIKFDYDSISEKCAKYDLDIVEAVEEEKTSWKFTMDIKGKQPKWMALFCWMHGECINIVNGRLYACGFMHSSQHFEKNFGVKFKRRNEDYVDLYAREK